jgi:glycine cleavage system H protein
MRLRNVCGRALVARQQNKRQYTKIKNKNLGEQIPMAKIPTNLKYTKSHEWFDPTSGKVGITDYAQHALGDLVFVNLPSVGDEVTAGKPFADVESVKAVADLNSPVNGTIAEVNEDLGDAPESLNKDAYGAWIVALKGVSGIEKLLSVAEYEAIIKE